MSGAGTVVSALRFRHAVRTVVCPLVAADYILSNRMAAMRRLRSDFTNGAQRQRLLEAVRHVTELFDRPCIIVERDRMKNGEKMSTAQKSL